MFQQKFFSTGQLAKLFSVTPDTVLKWIKQDKLSALRTAGGHYRISPEEVDSLLPQEKLSAPRVSLRDQHFLYCWEFFAEKRKTRPGCQDCLIFHSQALKCFEMNELPSGSGAKCGSCADSCGRCAYYHDQWGGPFKVLVVTDSPACREALTQGGTTPKIEFQFASGEYESSRVVDWFRPDFVIVDCTMPETKCRELCHHLANDPRIPRTTIILSTPPRRRALSVPGAIRIRNPLSLKEVKNQLDRLRKGQSVRGKWKEDPHGKQRIREAKT
jgi:excisionase family DNA binding protein